MLRGYRLLRDGECPMGILEITATIVGIVGGIFGIVVFLKGSTTVIVDIESHLVEIPREVTAKFSTLPTETQKSLREEIGFLSNRFNICKVAVTNRSLEKTVEYAKLKINDLRYVNLDQDRGTNGETEINDNLIVFKSLNPGEVRRATAWSVGFGRRQQPEVYLSESRARVNNYVSCPEGFVAPRKQAWAVLIGAIVFLLGLAGGILFTQYEPDNGGSIGLQAVGIDPQTIDAGSTNIDTDTKGVSINSGSTLPTGFDHISFGMSLSSLIALVGEEKSEVSTIAGMVSVVERLSDHAHFKSVTYYLSGDRSTKLFSIHFYFKSEAARVAILRQAITVFGEPDLSVLNLSYTWNDINGFEILIDQRSYGLSRAN